MHIVHINYCVGGGGVKVVYNKMVAVRHCRHTKHLLTVQSLTMKVYRETSSLSELGTGDNCRDNMTQFTCRFNAKYGVDRSILTPMDKKIFSYF